jgi:hypothetical protein
MNPGSIILQLIYYPLVAITVFLSVFAVYVLIRYGQSRVFSLFLGLTYAFFFILALSKSYASLQGIL